MRRWLTSVLAICLCAGAGPVLAEEAADRDDSRQELSLVGYEASVSVPAHWEVEPVVSGGPTGARLFEGSAFMVGAWQAAGSLDDGQWCYVNAYSRLGCAAPVDLEAELAKLDPEWTEYPVGRVARVSDDAIEGVTCVRHITTDGVDVYEVGCCGAETPADEWRSIVDTLELPAETRPARIAATGRSLAEDASATTDLWVREWASSFPEGLSGESWARPVNVPTGDPGIDAMLDALIPPADPITVTRISWADDAAGREVLAVDGVQAAGAAPEAVLAGMLSWTEAESAVDGGIASTETVRVAGMDALKVTGPGGDDATYVVAEGDSAVKVRAATDALALSWLEALPCDYLDFQRLRADALSVTWPDD